MLGINPADEFALFEEPVAASVICTGNVDTVITTDPTRVILAFSGDGSSVFKLRPTGSRPSSDIDTGLFLIPGSPLLILNYTQHGPLVQSGWQVIGQIAAILSVVTVQLRRDPSLSGYSGVFIDRSTVAPAQRPYQRRASAVSRSARRPAVYPRFLRERIAGILGEG